VALKPHLCVYICVATLEFNDLVVAQRVSVANLPFRRLMLNILSARYHCPIGRITDCIPVSVIARNVAFALSVPMPKRSATWSAVMVEWRSVDAKVLRAGVSSKSLSYVMVSPTDRCVISSFKCVKEGLIACRRASSDVGSRYSYPRTDPTREIWDSL
jgi:hypothetical protein